ncbi:MAG: globin [Roseimicrobium sp.]
MLETLCDRLGEDGLTQLVAVFYRRVRQDDVLGPLYPQDDWDGAEKRLRDFLIYRFGGSERYLQERGHPRLRARHLPFRIGLAERDRWLDLMGAAMKETNVPEDVAPVMGAFFAQVADMMRNQED